MVSGTQALSAGVKAASGGSSRNFRALPLLQGWREMCTPFRGTPFPPFLPLPGRVRKTERGVSYWGNHSYLFGDRRSLSQDW